MSKLEFEYNLYVGKHMEEPLRVNVPGREDVNNSSIYSVVGLQFYGSHNSVILNTLFLRTHIAINKCKPQLKSLDSLTDDEWLFVFCENSMNIKNYYIVRDKTRVRIYNNTGNNRKWCNNRTWCKNRNWCNNLQWCSNLQWCKN